VSGLHICMDEITTPHHDALLTDWIARSHWNIGLTVQPANPYYTAADMTVLGNAIHTCLQSQLFKSSVSAEKWRDLWMVLRSERSKGGGLEHLHALIRLDSNRKRGRLLHFAHRWIGRVCEEFALKRRGAIVEPQIHLFTAQTDGMDKWQSYLNKDAWRDRDGERWIFGQAT
jgi:hypothetical protein